MDHISQVAVEGNQGQTLRVVPNKHPPVPERGAAFEEKLAVAEQALRNDQMESDPVRLQNLAEEITYALSGLKSLKLSMDHDLKRVVVRVVDKRTNNVVRQIPNEQMVDLVKQMRDLEGLLFKASA